MATTEKRPQDEYTGKRIRDTHGQMAMPEKRPQDEYIGERIRDTHGQMATARVATTITEGTEPVERRYRSGNPRGRQVPLRFQYLT